MKIIREIIPYDSAYIIPFGDIHLEDQYFTEKSEKKLKEQIDFVKKHDNARAFLTGDIFNVATRTSKTSPFSINKKLLNKYNGDQMEYALDLFRPISDKIIGAIDGNHEQRTIDFNNRSWITELCGKLSSKEREVKYCDISCLLFLKIGKSRIEGERSAQTYSGYIHHTTGGGGTAGSKINRVKKLEDIVVACDFYIGAHNHMCGAVTLSTFIANNTKCTVTQINQSYIDAGGFLDYGGYVERFQLSPTTIGAPIIYFETKNKNIKINI